MLKSNLVPEYTIMNFNDKDWQKGLEGRKIVIPSLRSRAGSGQSEGSDVSGAEILRGRPQGVPLRDDITDQVRYISL